MFERIVMKFFRHSWLRAKRGLHNRSKIVTKLSIRRKEIKEKLSLLTVLAVLSISLPAQGQPWLGSGTEGDPYLIEDADDMQAIGADPNYWDAHFIMVNDINLAEYTGTQFNIIGNDSNAFTGVFDGNDRTILNYSCEELEQDGVGLFGYLASSGEGT